MQEFFLDLFEENKKTNIFVTSEIDEAIFLADNLVVLSNKPTTVQTVLNIKLPRPRDYKMLTTEQAFKYKKNLSNLSCPRPPSVAWERRLYPNNSKDKKNTLSGIPNSEAFSCGSVDAGQKLWSSL